MAAGSRTLKLSILGDVDNLLTNLKKGEKATNDYTTTLTDFGKKAALAFAAVAGAENRLRRQVRGVVVAGDGHVSHRWAQVRSPHR